MSKKSRSPAEEIFLPKRLLCRGPRFFSHCETMSYVVNTAQGSLQGKECVSCNGRKYNSFEGIPYAKPPVGNLRFRDPQEPEKWSGTRDATKPGNKCAQMDPYGKNALVGSEDCLYLNVYTPSLPQDKLEQLPVLFFVHGGRFLVGYGDYYRPDYFVERDVILVTINYRLHILGFLSLHTKEVPGNAAMKDAVMALKWVKRNIKCFNGDANNVTAIGESAGAGMVTSYVTSKMADGLYHKIIGESGVCLSDLLMIDEDPIEKAKHVASLLGHEFTDIKSLHNFLTNAPLEDLVFAASVAELSRPPYIINAYFLPVVEKKYDGVERYFEEFPLVTIKENRHKKVPILVGLNSHEAALFLRKDSEGNISYIKDVQRLIPRYLCMKYNSPQSIKLARVLKEYYFKDKDIGDETKEQYIDYISDAYFHRDIIYFAETCAKYDSKNVYLYNFTYHGNLHTRIMNTLGLKGSSHGDMLPYQFYRKNKADKITDQDKKVIDFLSEAWCNFVRNGKPSASNGPEWSPYTMDKRLCMVIDAEQKMMQYPAWDRIKCWLDGMGERSKL